MLREYKALVKDTYTGKYTVVSGEAYTKSDFINDLRKNGYKVNDRKAKRADVFDYIVNHTNMNYWDWEIKSVPEEVY